MDRRLNKTIREKRGNGSRSIGSPIETTDQSGQGQAIGPDPERRLKPGNAILIKDSIPARAAWIRSGLAQFVRGYAELLVPSQRPSFRRQSDIVLLGDPSADRGQLISQRAAVITLRYTLTKQAWGIMSATPHGADVTLLSGGPGVLTALRSALDQLQRPDIKLTTLDDGGTDTGAWQVCSRLRIQIRKTVRHMPIERELELPVIAPGVIFNLVRRSGRLDDETHQALRKYLCSAAPLLTDSEILLDSACETKGCLDRMASIGGQVLIHLDDRDAVTDISGPVELYFDRKFRAGVLGRPIRDVFPELKTKSANASHVEHQVSINGHAAVLTVVPLARKPKRTALILTPPNVIQRRRGVVREGGTTAESRVLACIIGSSTAIKRARRLAVRAGQSESPILIIGESGTGKELFAKAMHKLSRRANAPFIPINCAAIPESLIETELFGHEHGAFTGASRQGRASVFERAHRGTLFLDELADLSLHAQATLLRVLEEGAVTRVGGNRAVSVDVRVIGAAIRPLEDLISEGVFRRDVYHRLCVIPLRIPPLRERPQDIPVLARDFLEALGDSRALPDEVLDYLLRYRWPGNVRELQHCLRYMATMTDDPFTVADLPPYIQPCVQINDPQEALSGIPPHAGNPFDNPMVPPENLCSSLPDEHCRIILDLIESANHAGATIGRRSLRDKVRQAGLALTERAVRRRLRALQADGLVEWGLGRSGVSLTAKGRNAQQHVRDRT